LTEGKTDILYIKAALKNLYKEYPSLIKKDASGKFQFHISFFNRTKHWKYFFDMSPDGADAIKSFYCRYWGTTSENLCEYFRKIGTSFSPSPVVFLLDNEQNSKRPLRSFIKCAKLSDSAKSELEKIVILNLIVIVISHSFLFHYLQGKMNVNLKICLQNQHSQSNLEEELFRERMKTRKNTIIKIFSQDIFTKIIKRLILVDSGLC